MKTRTLVLDNNVYRMVHYTDTRQCHDEVREANELYWSKRKTTPAYENYRFDSDAVPWALGPMLLNNKFDLGFSVLYKNDKLFSVGGIRRHSDEIALILNRHFSFFTLKPLTHATLIPFQLDICKQACMDQAWITVNGYNTWHKTWYDHKGSTKRTQRNKTSELYAQAKKVSDLCTNLGTDTINNTQQEILRWKL